MQLIFCPVPVAAVSRRFASRRDPARVDLALSAPKRVAAPGVLMTTKPTAAYPDVWDRLWLPLDTGNYGQVAYV